VDRGSEGTCENGNECEMDGPVGVGVVEGGAKMDAARTPYWFRHSGHDNLRKKKVINRECENKQKRHQIKSLTLGRIALISNKQVLKTSVHFNV